jgi:hypothetical protein
MKMTVWGHMYPIFRPAHIAQYISVPLPFKTGKRTGLLHISGRWSTASTREMRQRIGLLWDEDKHESNKTWKNPVGLFLISD